MADPGYVRPQWHYSAICPEGYAWVAPWCQLKGYVGQPPDGPPPLLQPTEFIALESKRIANDVAIRMDDVVAKTDMALMAGGLSLLIALIALLSTHLKPQKEG